MTLRTCMSLALLLGLVGAVPGAAQSAATTVHGRGRGPAMAQDEGSWERRQIRDEGGPMGEAVAMRHPARKKRVGRVSAEPSPRGAAARSGRN